MKTTVSALAACILTGTVPLAKAQDDAPVSRAEYNKLKSELKTEHEQRIKEMAEFKEQMKQLMQQNQLPSQPTPEQKHSQPANGTRSAAPEATANASVEELSEEVADLKEQVHEIAPGSSQFSLSGWADADFLSENIRSYFSADFNPVFRFKINDDFFFESWVAFYQSNSSIDVQLQTAELSYILNDYMTLSAGKFTNPANYFADHFLMGLANKLPDPPLVASGPFMPEFDDGAQIHGSIPIGSTQVKYSGFVATSPGGSQIGGGGYLGFLPIPELEIGYGVQSFKIDQRFTYTYYDIYGYEYDEYYNNGINPVVQSLNLSYVKDTNTLNGVINLQAQWMWLNAHGNNNPDLPDGDYNAFMYPYNAAHDGGYVQLAYRPTHLGGLISHLEPVVRYDASNMEDDTSGRADLERWSFGLNYWFNDSTALKAAFELLDEKAPDSQIYPSNIYLLELSAGF